jgi:putative ABC transport system ATP-binding protein
MGYALRMDATADAAAHLARLPRIAAEGLSFEVGRRESPRRIVDDVSFGADAGEVFTVLGPSGSGKSTLLRCLNRLAEPSAGRVLLGGTPAADIPVQALRRRVGMVFQAAALFDGSVLDNVLYGPRLQASAGAPAPLGDAEAERERAAGLLARVGLPVDFVDKPAHELSGGEAQRVSLARALANEPEVLLLDEPTAALDPTAGRLIEDLLLRLAAETDLTFLFVTHNLAQARRIGDRGLLLVDGRVVDAGPLPDFLDDPASEITRLFAAGRLQVGDACGLTEAAPSPAASSAGSSATPPTGTAR